MESMSELTLDLEVEIILGMKDMLGLRRSALKKGLIPKLSTLRILQVAMPQLNSLSALRSSNANKPSSSL